MTISRLLALFALTAALACGSGEKDFTFLVRDVGSHGVAGIEVRLAGQDRRLGVTDTNGQATVRLHPAKDANVRIRLSDPAAANSPRYRFPEVIELDEAALESGSKTIWLEAVQTAESDSTAPATLRITSEPSGGNAFLDGADLGPTPAERAGVAPGRHQIEVRMAGRLTYAMEVVLEPGEHTFHADLPPAAEARATLRVSSDPAGADIALDGRSTGQQTPATLSGLPPGRHALRLQLAGYAPWQTSVDLVAGGPGGSAGGALRPLAVAGGERGTSRPPTSTPPSDGGFSREYLVGTAPGWAEVYLDGESANRNVAGHFKARLNAGRHSFHVLNSRAGVDVTLGFVVKPGDPNGRLVLDYGAGQVVARP